MVIHLYSYSLNDTYRQQRVDAANLSYFSKCFSASSASAALQVVLVLCCSHDVLLLDPARRVLLEALSYVDAELLRGAYDTRHRVGPSHVAGFDLAGGDEVEEASGGGASGSGERG